MSSINQDNLIKAAKYSLAFLWIFTGLTSSYFSPEIGYEILTSANITGSLADIAVYLWRDPRHNTWALVNYIS
ncbi:hypothetical protein L3081_14515 [Colwellia sp. MSW7]|uniref:Uncharacterized protein n=1 Tax=Colwellia maritima TaxID=2912588 RepID=A0ABS9X2B0_9GAMM|nr:hypothetical protein [Colwellia maritima]MCI2284376.1 hypothetical protein [Colwellia maritima]